MGDFYTGFALPQLFLLGFGLAALAAGLWSARDGWLWHCITPASVSITGLVLTVYAQIVGVLLVIPRFGPLTITMLRGSLTIDAAGTLFGIFISFGALLVVIMSMQQAGKFGTNQGELYSVLLWATCGATLCAYAGDLLSMYLCIELLSIPSYVLAGFNKDDARSNEASIKYFLFGGACSAIMIYGISLIFGMTGSLNLAEIGQKLSYGVYTAEAVWLGLVMILAGVGFKVSLVPFHQWAPDAYEGAPTPITAYLSVVSKAAGLALLLRLVWTVLGGSVDWVMLMVVVSGVTMTLGNLSAIVQKDVKRMLAYSSIAQAGYILIGVAAIGAQGRYEPGTASAGILIYIAGYLLANLGAFACVMAVESDTGSTSIDAFHGAISRSPVLAVCLVIFLLSLAGIPPTLGFAGKFWVFAAAIKTGAAPLWWLAAIGVANSVVSVYYYFNVARVMFFDDNSASETVRLHPGPRSVMVFCAAATMLCLVFLQPVARICYTNAWLFFGPH